MCVLRFFAARTKRTVYCFQSCSAYFVLRAGGRLWFTGGWAGALCYSGGVAAGLCVCCTQGNKGGERRV